MANPVLEAFNAGDHRRALLLAQETLLQSPTHPNSWILFGVCLMANDAHDEAAIAFSTSVALNPGGPAELNNLALVLLKHEAYEKAERWVKRVFAIDPAFSEGFAILGSILHSTRRFDEADCAIRKAIVLDPLNANHYLNLANAWTEREDADQTAKFLLRSLTIKPDLVNARFQLACYFLQHGDLAQGWTLYEWRFVSPYVVRPRPYNLPWWDGKPIGKQKLLVWGEQGIGDEILFASALDYVPTGSIVEVDKRLVSLFERSFPEHKIIPRLPIPHPYSRNAKFQIGMGSLAPLMGQVQRPRAILVPNMYCESRARKWLATLTGRPFVGIAWRSRKRDFSGGAHRFHFPLLDWAPILTASHKPTFICLQYGEVEEELEEVYKKLGVRIFKMPDLDLFNDIEGVVGLASALDLQITTGTSAGLFGAMTGLETWYMTPRTDYTSLGQDEYPWLPNVRTFFREPKAPWAPVVERVASMLRHTFHE